MICRYFLLCLCIIGTLYKFVENHTCKHPYPKKDELVTGVKIEPISNVFLERQSWESNLQIYFDYQKSFTQSSSFQTLKTTVLEPARDILQALLKAKSPINGNLLVNRACENGRLRMSRSGVIGCADGCTTTSCVNVVVPETYLKKCLVIDANGNERTSGSDGAGVLNYDLVLLVTYLPCSGGTLAYAASCFLESTIDRPILGVVNLCSDKIQPHVRVEENIKIVIHEMIHALGISIDKYAFYRYDNGTPIVPRNSFGLPIYVDPTNSFYFWNDVIIKLVTRNRASVTTNYKKTFYGLVLPNVLKAARDHFNCPTLDAVDLEEYGTIGDGSTISHFDEYFLNNELMTPITNNETDFLSKITLALLQDTGWYTVNPNNIGNLNYGYKAGCMLPKEGCYTYMQSQILKNEKIYPFCNRKFGERHNLNCSGFNNNKCFCSLFKYWFFNNEYIYFTDIDGVPRTETRYYRGLNPFNEYCPVLISSASIQQNHLMYLYPVMFLLYVIRSI